MKIGVIRFPGTNNDHETIRSINSFEGLEAVFIPHYKPDLIDECDGIWLPGGFSYGDYLRCGAVAAHSECLDKIKELALSDKPILGVCNGFQILTEAELLEGVLLQNISTRFVSKWVTIKAISEKSHFTKNIKEKVLTIPVAHYEGRYFHYNSDNLFRNGQVVFQYSTLNGGITEDANPNGAIKNIAGITNVKGNIMGLMPHPERASFLYQGSDDGRFIVQHFLEGN